MRKYRIGMHIYVPDETIEEEFLDGFIDWVTSFKGEMHGTIVEEEQ